MELIELKEAWDRMEEKEKSELHVPRKSLINAIRKESNTIFSQILRTVRYKFVWSLIATAVSFMSVPVYILKSAEDSFFFGLLSGTEVGIIMILAGTLLLGISINYRISYRLIKAHQISAKSLKESIREVINITRSINRASTYSDAYGVPVFLSWILYIVLFKHYHMHILWGTVTMASTCYVSFLLIEAKGKWFARKKYGNYLNKLESNLKELNEIKLP